MQKKKNMWRYSKPTVRLEVAKICVYIYIYVCREVSTAQVLKVYGLSFPAGPSCAGAEDSQPFTNACVTVVSPLYSFITMFETKILIKLMIIT
jgi:hypothetical protein